MGFNVPASEGGPTPPSLADWQFQYNGVTFGASEEIGILEIRGLGDLPNVRNGDIPFPRDHGEEQGLDVLAGRDPEFDLWIKAGTTSVLGNVVDLATAMVPQPNTVLPLWFQLPGYPLMCSMCRPRMKPAPWDAEFTMGARQAPKLTLHANDPRLYGETEVSSASLGAATGGLAFPVGPFPVGPFSSTTPSQVTITNAGNFESRPIILINGPMIDPVLTNSTITGNPYLKISNPTQSPDTVNSGDQLLVDLNTPHRMLYYVGGYSSGSTPSNVRSWLVQGSNWWNLPPGDNTISLTAAGGSGSIDIWWASAWTL